ncbi:FitA-like ribbon-helix-helix domain-containing protein [Hoeflea ulvae]|uniref:Plasmid stabilization protein n=1 Tax=Hoeflea ulvae TaxID=2983764 RepID=A0ABT3YB90_9HYPH|nr:plasmid stabilization protein [Hoeflea ulvae]MCY0093140.1 plasmid stabilization protein [Hoeflea ulvae]
MATLTIRNLDDSVKQALRERAARHGVSMEEEARVMLREGLVEADNVTTGRQESLWDRVTKLREKYGTADLEIPERTELAGERDVFADWRDEK